MLAVLALLNLCFAVDSVQSLQSWLHCATCKTLSSRELLHYVPAPLNPEPVEAYDRFSFLGAIERFIQGPTEIVHSREQTITEEEVLGVENLYKRGLVYFWALGGIERNLTRAFEYFEAEARKGDQDAMFYTAVAYSTGFLGEVPTLDPGKATLYYALSAAQGSLLSNIAMGHRKSLGINSVVDTDAALGHYSYVGDALLDSLQAEHQGPHWYSSRAVRRTYAFGAESNTGLYGRHTYKKMIPPDVQTVLKLGDQSSAWDFVSTGFVDEFDNLEEAIETFAYRAQEENDITALYAMALIFGSGTDTRGPLWDKAVLYAKMCDSAERISIKSTLHVSQHLAVRSFCQEFLAERYLHGNEGVQANVGLARKYYLGARRTSEKAQSITDSNGMSAFGSQGYNLGLALCDWVEGKLTPFNISSTFKEALSSSVVTSDYTVPMLLADIQLNKQHDTYGAMETLRKAVRDTKGLAPEASIRLGQLEKQPQMKLKRYVQGIYLLEDMYSPIEFAQASYDRGDIESAVLAYMLCSELGIRSAVLNLADLLDVRHSYIGGTYGDRWPRLRAVSEWPVPKFITHRIWRAAHYFTIAAAHESIDGLTKMVEYGKSYGLLPDSLYQWYLDMLSMYNYGYAHWMKGNLYYAKKRYARAMECFSRAMISPEAWVPVKFSQFLTALHLLNGEDGDGSMDGTTLWGRLVEAYHTIIAVDGGSSISSRRKHGNRNLSGNFGNTNSRLAEHWFLITLAVGTFATLFFFILARYRRD